MSDCSIAPSTEASHSSPTTQSQPAPRQLDFATLLSHPHDLAELQATSPFWHQYPDQPLARNNFCALHDFYSSFLLYYIDLNMSDQQPLIIGHGSRYGHSHGNLTKKNDHSRQPKETVKVWLGDEEVGVIHLSLLTRFSKLAKITFRRPAQTNKDADVPAEMEETKRDTIAMANSPIAEGAAELSIQKQLGIGVPTAYIQPKLAEVKHILAWMSSNKASRHHDPLLPLIPVPLPAVTTRALLDTYLAVLAYDLTPFPHDLRHEILSRLTTKPVQKNQMEYMYDRLPLNDPIVNRMVTSVLEHREAQRYSEDDFEAILAYVENDVQDGGVDDQRALSRHFARVKNYRGRKAREAHRGQKREEALIKLKSGFEAMAGPIQEAALTADRELKSGQGETSGRRRNRRQQWQQQQHEKVSNARVK